MATEGDERWPEVFDGWVSREKRELLSLGKFGQGFDREKEKKIKKKGLRRVLNRAPERRRFGCLMKPRVRVFSHGPPDPIVADPGSDPLGVHTRGTCNPIQIRPGPVSRPGDASDDVTTALTALTAFGTAVGPHLAAF